MVSSVLLLVSSVASYAACASDKYDACVNSPLVAEYVTARPDVTPIARLSVQPKPIERSPIDIPGFIRRTNRSEICIALVVRETGVISDVAVMYPKDFKISRSEMNALKKWRWMPGRIDDVSVATVVTIGVFL